VASEFHPGCSAFNDTATHLVVRAAGCLSGALGGRVAERRSTVDDFVLVH
jgi:hypothetical protein